MDDADPDLGHEPIVMLGSGEALSWCDHPTVLREHGRPFDHLGRSEPFQPRGLLFDIVGMAFELHPARVSIPEDR